MRLRQIQEFCWCLLTGGGRDGDGTPPGKGACGDTNGGGSRGDQAHWCSAQLHQRSQRQQIGGESPEMAPLQPEAGAPPAAAALCS